MRSNAKINGLKQKPCRRLRSHEQSVLIRGSGTFCQQGRAFEWLRMATATLGQLLGALQWRTGSTVARISVQLVSSLTRRKHNEMSVAGSRRAAPKRSADSDWPCFLKTQAVSWTCGMCQFPAFSSRASVCRAHWLVRQHAPGLNKTNQVQLSTAVAEHSPHMTYIVQASIHS